MFYYQGKLLKLKKQGFFSSYFIYKTFGIKILHKQKKGSKNSKDLLKSSSWKIAKREFNLLKDAQTYGLSPKVYDIVPIMNKKNKLWYPAIIMDHVPGKGLHKIYAVNPKVKFLWRGKKILSTELREKLEKFFLNKKIKHRDLHFANIVVTNYRAYKVIDFGLAHRIK